MPEPDDVPSTVARSPGRARRTWSAAHDSAVQTYGEGERAHRTAFAALEHGFEKVGDQKHLLDVASRLEIRGRSRMTKDELVEAIVRADRRATERARRP